MSKYTPPILYRCESCGAPIRKDEKCQWISVDESLPSDNKPYVVMTKKNDLGVSRLMGRNRVEWTLFGEPVLYWLPIPEPPETTKG